MAVWQEKHLNIRPILDKYEEGITLTDIAHELGEYLKKEMVSLVKDYLTRAELNKLILKLINFNEDAYDDYEVEVFDRILNDVYNIADDERIWVEPF